MNQHRAPDVLVVGEALVDIVRSGDGDVEHVGGSPANVALGLGRQGVAVALLTRIGDDARGRSIREHVAAAGVDVLAASTTADPTSTAVATIGADGSADYEFDIRWDIDPSATSATARIVHTGSIAAFLEPGAGRVRELIARAGDAIVTFDPNIRPALLGERDDAVRTFESIVPLCTIVKMSDEDAAWLYPGVAMSEVLVRVLSLGAEVGAITRGGDGAILASAQGVVEVPGVAVAAVDTIGAGDTFMASLIHSALRNGVPRTPEQLATAGGRAARAAAITVSRAGADLPWSRELEDPSGAS